MRNQDELLVRVEMFVKDLVDFIAQLCSGQCRMCDSERDGHQLNGNDPNLVIRILGLNARYGVEFVQEVRVGIKTNANSMDKNNRKLCC